MQNICCVERSGQEVKSTDYDEEIFGKNIFWAYLPTTISAIIMLFITYKLHEEFFDKKNAIVSPLILATTFLWFDYSHLATQDMVFSCLVTIGIFCLVKINDKKVADHKYTVKKKSNDTYQVGKRKFKKIRVK